MLQNDPKSDGLASDRPSPWPIVGGAMAVAVVLSSLVLAFAN
ncbi:hypothetical protein [Roseibium aquae]|nr:hypothetical protein [Roseibium aquae]